LRGAQRAAKPDTCDNQLTIKDLASLWGVPSVYSLLAREIGSNQGHLGEVCRYLLSSPGKGLRPLLVLICSTFGDLDKVKRVRLAACMELLHLAMLVHDDIVDASPLRRGNLSINFRWNNNTAILTGDYLFGKSLEMVSGFGTRVVQRFANVITQSCSGEFRQAEGLFDVSMDVDDYKEIIRKKTAVMIANCCAAAGIASEAGENIISCLENFGLALGMAFQIRDDVADWNRGEKELGKPVIHDLRQGIVTLPLLFVLRLSKKKDTIRDIIISKNISEKQLSFIQHEIITTNSLGLAIKTASEYIERAHQHLGSLPETAGRQALEQLLSITFESSPDN